MPADHVVLDEHMHVVVADTTLEISCTLVEPVETDVA
jgi:hypothetical protein